MACGLDGWAAAGCRSSGSPGWVPACTGLHRCLAMSRDSATEAVQSNPSRVCPTPNHCRGQAIALATLTNFGSNFLVSLLLPSVQEQIGQGGELPWGMPDGCWKARGCSCYLAGCLLASGLASHSEGEMHAIPPYHLAVCRSHLNSLEFCLAPYTSAHTNHLSPCCAAHSLFCLCRSHVLHVRCHRHCGGGNHQCHCARNQGGPRQQRRALHGCHYCGTACSHAMEQLCILCIHYTGDSRCSGAQCTTTAVGSCLHLPSIGYQVGNCPCLLRRARRWRRSRPCGRPQTAARARRSGSIS